MPTIGYIVKINEIRDAVYNLINAGNIFNLNTKGLTLVKRAIPENFSVDDCPLISVYRTEAAGGEITSDEDDLKLPRNIRITIGISDCSMVDLDDAEKLTDDLIDKILTQLDTGPTLSGKAKGILVERISFDDDSRNGAWFSEPSIQLLIRGITL